jgi:hypothetical protein
MSEDTDDTKTFGEGDVVLQLGAYLQGVMDGGDATEMWVENADEVGAVTGEVEQVQTFEEAGLMTRNTGLVVAIGGRKFQITVVDAGPY